MSTLVITTNLGRLKAYRVAHQGDEPSPNFDTIRDEDFENRHSHVTGRVTDQAGRFPSGKEGMSYGERHGEAEQARQAQLLLVARTVNEVAEAEPGSPIYIAASKSICTQLLDSIAPNVRERISKSLALDLVKLAKLDLLRRFEEK